MIEAQINFLCKFVRGMLSKEIEVFVSSLWKTFLILLPVASFKKISDRPEKCGIL